MKNLNTTVVFLLIAILSTFNLNAETLKQSFSANFGKGWYTDDTAEGWKFINFCNESSSSYVLDGTHAGTIQTGTGNPPSKLGSLTTPEKTGGVGLVCFWAKMKSPINDGLTEVKVSIQTSDDGEVFTTAETINIPAKDATNYRRYTVMVNNATAKYARIELLNSRSYSTYDTYLYVNIDELIVTDAPGSDLSISYDITGEVAIGNPNTIRIQGTALTSDVTFSVRADSPFSLASATVTVPFASLNVGYDLPITFTPTGAGLSKGVLVASNGQFSDMIFPISGEGADRNIVEGFNSSDIGTYPGDYSYLGWQIKSGSRITAVADIFEGSGALHFYNSIATPSKIGGVGEISFWYRAEASNSTVAFTVSTSVDGENWVVADSKNATETTYKRYHKVLNDENVKYVKITVPSNQSSDFLIVDALVITEKDKTIANAETSDEHVFVFNTLPFNGSIPIAFQAISENVSLSTEQSNMSLGKTTLTTTEATGTYSLPLTLDGIGADVDFINGNIKISDGGLYFPFKTNVLFYRAQKSLFIDFDTTWDGSGNSGTHITNQGWKVIKGYRTTYGAFNGSAASLSISNGGSLISPPVSSGMGSIQFYSKISSVSSPALVTLYVSADRQTWTAKGTFEVTSDVYKAFDLVINDATAKYAKIDVAGLTAGSNPTLSVDNITITEQGVGIPKVYLEAEPFFAGPEGVMQPVTVKIVGQNITSNLNLSLKNGTAFSVGELTTIPASEINNKVYSLPVEFTPEGGVYFADDIILSGDDFSFDQVLPIKGYTLKDLLFEGFEDTFTAVVGEANTYIVNAWTTVQGSRLTNSYKYEGTTSLQLMAAASSTSNASLISPPKSGGVGVIQFYYRNNTSGTTPSLEIRTYKNLTDAPTVIETITIPQSATYAMYEKVINDSEARYVELVLIKPESGTTLYTYIDNVIVTASQKGIPQVTIPEKIAVSTYKGEAATYEFEIKAQNIEDLISLSLEKGTNFELDITELTPVDASVTATVKITYTPGSDAAYSGDNLLIKSKGLLQSITIPVSGFVLDKDLSQDFNSEWGSMNAGVYNVDGWVLNSAARKTNPSGYFNGAAGAVFLLNNSTPAHSIISPAKVPGVKKVEFTYYTSANTNLTVYIDTSVDGSTWEQKESITSLSTYALIPVEKEINDKNARYVRIRIEAPGAYRIEFTIDDIKITGMPYLHQRGTIEPIETALSPLEIPVRIIGSLDSDATISMAGGEESAFALSQTTLTPQELEDDKEFELTLTFAANESREYEDAVLITNEEGDHFYLVVDLSVDYSKPYVVQLNETEPMEINSVPVTIPISLGGFLGNDATISITGDDSANFTPSITSITPEEVGEGVNLTVEFTAETSGEYEAELLVSDDNNEYLRIPLKVTCIMPHVELAEAIEPIQTSISPLSIPVSVKGFLMENVTITTEGERSTYFELSETTITPDDLSEGKAFDFNLIFNSMKSGEYKVNIVISSDDNEYLEIPVVINYQAPHTNGEVLIEGCNFEINEAFADWKSYDLDGKTLSIFFNQPKGWYWAYELNTEVPESNSVMAATSMFVSNEMDDITPANDWLFSMPLEVPESGSYGVAWDARSFNASWLENYEMRVIDDATLTELEASFEEDATSLTDVSNALIAHSDLIFSVYEESADWTTRKFNVDAYKGKTIRVIWRYTSGEQHTLYIDNFKFYFEVIGSYIAATPDIAYTQVPEFAMTNHSPQLQVVVNNGAGHSLSDVEVKVSINSWNDQVIYSKEVDIPTLATNDPVTIKTDNTYADLSGSHYYTVDVKGDVYNNTVVTDLFAGFEVTPNTYAFDNGDIEGGAYSSSEGFLIGQKYPIEVDSYLESIDFALTSSSTSTSVKIHLYELVNDEPVLIQSIGKVPVSFGSEKVYTATLPSRYKMEAGKTYFVAIEPLYGESLYLAKTSNRVGSIAAFYTTANAEWIWLLDDHTLYIRLNAYSSGVGMNHVSSNMDVYVDQNGTLHVVNAKVGDDLTIYDTQGKLLIRDVIKSNNDTFAMPAVKGVYVVKTGNTNYKVVR